jgi:propionate CoA-transferase
MPKPTTRRRSLSSRKVVSAAEAVRHIRSNTTLATGGFLDTGFADGLAFALEQRFMGQDPLSPSGSPSGLTLVYAGGEDDGKYRDLNHLAHAGMLRCLIGAHVDLPPKLHQLALSNQIEAHNLPQGVISQLFREMAAHRPGLLTHVGAGTFVDPRHGGGRVNACSHRAHLDLLELAGAHAVLHKAFPIHACLLRASTADTHGNISMGCAGLTFDNLAMAMAMATHNAGGTVIVQVERLAQAGSLPARQVRIPGMLVDYVVLAEQSEHHGQTFAEPYRAVFAGELRASPMAHPQTPLNVRRGLRQELLIAAHTHTTP